jgi:hypothetical protein
LNFESSAQISTVKKLITFGIISTALWVAVGGITFLYLHQAGLTPRRQFADSDKSIQIPVVAGRTIRLLAVTDSASLPSSTPGLPDIAASIVAGPGSQPRSVTIRAANSTIVSRRNKKVVASAILFAEVIPPVTGDLSISVSIPVGANYRIATEVTPWPMVITILSVGLGSALAAVPLTAFALNRPCK